MYAYCVDCARLLPAVCCLMMLCTPAKAGVTSFGAVFPIPPTEGGTVENLNIGTPETQSLPFGTVTVDGGTQLEAVSVLIGTNPGFSGTLNVTQPGSRFLSGIPLGVGVGGVGDLNVTDGGSVVSNGLLIGQQNGIGTATVSGVGSLLVNQNGPFRVERSGSRLTVENGGRLISSNSGAEVSGLVAVDGPDSLLQSLNGVLNIRGGEFRVTDGGRLLTSGPTVISLGVNVPSSTVGQVTVSGQDSLWSAQVEVQLLNGSIRVEDGGQALLGQQLEVQRASSIVLDQGTITTSSLENRGFLSGGGTIATGSRGFVNNEDGGIIQVGFGETLTIDSTLSNSGSVSVRGGVLDVAWVIQQGRSQPGTIAVENGELRFRNGINGSRGGTLALLGGANNIFGPVTSMNALITGNSRNIFHDSFSGSVQISEGSTLTVLGDLHILGEGSQLVVEEGLSPLAVGQLANLAGELEVSLAADTEVSAGDRFTLMTAAEGINGEFQQVTYPQVPGVMWLLEIEDFQVTLVAGLQGDYNGDGTVDAADYTVWREADERPIMAADGNNDGTVDAEDYRLWRENFGATVAATTVSSLVPEPTGLTLLLSLLAVASGCRVANDR